MKALFLALLVFFSGVIGVGAEIQRGSFSMSWAAGFQETSDSNLTKIQFVSEVTKEGVTISLVSHTRRDEAGFTRLRKSFTEYAETELIKTAKRHGKVVIALSREDLPSSAIVFSLGERNEKRNQFGVFFLHISPQGRIAQVVVEGTGRPEEKLRFYRPYLDSVQWKEELNPTPRASDSASPDLTQNHAPKMRDVTIETKSGRVETWKGKAETPLYDTARDLTEKERQWIKDRSMDVRRLAKRYGLEQEKLGAEELDLVFSAWLTDGKDDRPKTQFVVESVGTTLGELLCANAGYQWKRTKDRMGETYAVIQEKSDYVCFPIDSVAKRAAKEEDHFIARLYSVSRDLGMNEAARAEVGPEGPKS